MINKRNKLRLINIEKDAYIKNLKKETLFETYEDLPQWLKNELFIRHIHADTGCDEDKPYNEKRVKNLRFSNGFRIMASIISH